MRRGLNEIGNNDTNRAAKLRAEPNRHKNFRLKCRALAI